MKEEICKCGHEAKKHYVSAYMENGCYPLKKCFVKDCCCEGFVDRIKTNSAPKEKVK